MVESESNVERDVPPRKPGNKVVMRVVVLIARILLGLIFLVLGLNGFVHFIPAPPPTGLAAEFTNVLVTSHYSVLVFGVQVIAAVMLLTNQFVPLALVLLAAVIANILTFHITMVPSGLPLALFVTVLWVIVALQFRPHLALLFARTGERN
jgi:putative oxidoreductase